MCNLINTHTHKHTHIIHIMVGVLPRALWLAGTFSCLVLFGSVRFGTIKEDDSRGNRWAHRWWTQQPLEQL